MLNTSVLDTADWTLAVPLLANDGSSLDFSGTLLTATVAPVFGGDAIATVSSATGTLTFVAASGNLPAYFSVRVPVEGRTWRASRPTKAIADVKRHPDPSHLATEEWLGRLNFMIQPGSDSSGIAVSAYAPVLLDVQPYDGHIASPPMVVGPQGVSGAPTYQLVAPAAGVLTINMRSGAYARVNLSSPAALNLTGWPTDFSLGRLTVELDIAPGATVLSYPPGVLWSSGAPPLLSPGPAKDILMFTSIDGGVTVFGHIVGQSYR